MIDIIGTGLSGLVGSRVKELLKDSFVFQDLSRETGYDITDVSSLEDTITASKSSWVFHFAAFTDVQGAESQRDQKDGPAWQINVEATKNLAEICKNTHKKLLYISTDYVFSGDKEMYAEDDTPQPMSWYGVTKYEGEKQVYPLGDQMVIVRISNPYRSHPVGKMDFVHKIVERLKNKLQVQAPEDQEFSPTYIDDLASAIQAIVKANASGIYHVCSKEGITPYSAALDIASTFSLDTAFVEPTTYETYFQGKAKAPQHAVLKHDKILQLGVNLHSFKEGLEEVKTQEQIAP